MTIWKAEDRNLWLGVARVCLTGSVTGVQGELLVVNCFDHKIQKHCFDHNGRSLEIATEAMDLNYHQGLSEDKGLCQNNTQIKVRTS